MNLSSADRFVAGRQVTEFTDEALRAAGREGHEAFVLWTGVIDGDAFIVRNAHMPKQTGYRSEEGVCVRVDGDELHRLNVWLYEHSELLGVQVHSHPTDAFHSETDDSYPIATTVGALSVVVPRYGRGGVQGSGVAVYRFDARHWNRIGHQAQCELLRFEP